MEGGGGGQTKMEKWSHTLGQGSRGVMRAAGKYLYKLDNLCRGCPKLNFSSGIGPKSSLAVLSSPIHPKWCKVVHIS